jgi:hypothetical protein
VANEIGLVDGHVIFFQGDCRILRPLPRRLLEWCCVWVEVKRILSVLASDIFGLGLRLNPTSYNPTHNSNASRKFINKFVEG